MALPSKIVAGDQVSFTTKLKNYSSTDGWALTYHLVNYESHESVDGTPDGDAWSFTITAAKTSDYSPGQYDAFAIVSRDEERISIIRQKVQVLPNPAAGAGDFRSQAEIALDAVEAMLARKATQDQKAVTIDGHLITRFSFDELMRHRDRLRREVQQEREREANDGRTRKRVVRTRMK